MGPRSILLIACLTIELVMPLWPLLAGCRRGRTVAAEPARLGSGGEA